MPVFWVPRTRSLTGAIVLLGRRAPHGYARRRCGEAKKRERVKMENKHKNCYKAAVAKILTRKWKQDPDMARST